MLDEKVYDDDNDDAPSKVVYSLAWYCFLSESSFDFLIKKIGATKYLSWAKKIGIPAVQYSGRSDSICFACRTTSSFELVVLFMISITPKMYERSTAIN